MFQYVGYYYYFFATLAGLPNSGEHIQ